MSEAKPEKLQRFKTTTQQKVILQQEQRQRASRKWHPWTTQAMTAEMMADQEGWLKDIHTIYSNGWCAVMVRDLETEIGIVQHVTITTASRNELKWAELQRIKHDLFGPLSQALQVYPRKDRLVESYATVHLWVVDHWIIPFGISAKDPAIEVRYRPPAAELDELSQPLLETPDPLPIAAGDNLVAPEASDGRPANDRMVSETE